MDWIDTGDAQVLIGLAVMFMCYVCGLSSGYGVGILHTLWRDR